MLRNVKFLNICKCRKLEVNSYIWPLFIWNCACGINVGKYALYCISTVESNLKHRYNFSSKITKIVLLQQVYGETNIVFFTRNYYINICMGVMISTYSWSHLTRFFFSRSHIKFSAPVLNSVITICYPIHTSSVTTIPMYLPYFYFTIPLSQAFFYVTYNQIRPPIFL